MKFVQDKEKLRHFETNYVYYNRLESSDVVVCTKYNDVPQCLLCYVLCYVYIPLFVRQLSDVEEIRVCFFTPFGFCEINRCLNANLS